MLELSSPALLTSAVDEFTAEASPDSPVLIASDFDGVLSPLVDDPALSRPLPQATTALMRIAVVGGGIAPLALVSGRDLLTLATLAEPPVGTHLIGSHGAEQGHIVASTAPGGPSRLEYDPITLTATQRDQLDALSAGLAQIVAPFEGAWVEHKPAAAVLHTRLADPDQALLARAQAHALGAEVGIVGQLGKDVVEFALIETDKGIALTALRNKLGATKVLYMGDDVTDEHAFARLGPYDLTVRVGPGASLARFQIADPVAASGVLTEVADALERRVRALV